VGVLGIARRTTGPSTFDHPATTGSGTSEKIRAVVGREGDHEAR
jgi:hypothetical protein